MARARKRFAPALPRAGLGRQAGGRDRPAPRDRFIEIGPGRGAITCPLAARVERLRGRSKSIAISRRRSQARALPNVTVVTATCSTSISSLAIGAAKLRPAAVRVVGNLPYNISSPILFRLLAAARRSGLLQRCDADAAEGGGGSADREARHRRVRRADAVHGARRRRDASCSRCRPARFAPPRRSARRSSGSTFGRRHPRFAIPRCVVEIVRSVFTQRRKTLSNALAPFATARGRSAAEALRRGGYRSGRRPAGNALELTELPPGLRAPSVAGC